MMTCQIYVKWYLICSWLIRNDLRLSSRTTRERAAYSWYLTSNETNLNRNSDFILSYFTLTFISIMQNAEIVLSQRYWYITRYLQHKYLHLISFLGITFRTSYTKILHLNVTYSVFTADVFVFVHNFHFVRKSASTLQKNKISRSFLLAVALYGS